MIWQETIKFRTKINVEKIIETINESKSCFFEKINRIYKHLFKLTTWQKEKIQPNKIRDKNWNLTTNTKEIKRIISTLFTNL